MAISKNRAYLRALSLYQTRTGIAPLDSDRNIVQDIVQAILEEVQDHFKVNSGQAVTGSITIPSGSTGGTYSLNSGVVSTSGTVEQVP